MRPSERIAQIENLLVAATVKQALAKESTNLLLTISGATAADIGATVRADGKMLLVAIVLYMDEVAGGKSVTEESVLAQLKEAAI